MQCEVIGVTEFVGNAIAQVAQLDQAGFERGTGFFRCFPDCAAFSQIRGRQKQVIDPVCRDRLAVELKLEAVERGRLLCFGSDPRGDKFGVGHWSLRGIANRLLQLAHSERVELGAVVEQRAGLGDQSRVAVERGIGLPRHLRCGVVCRCDIGGGGPLRLAIDAVESLVAGVDQGKKPVGPVLNGCSGLRGASDDPKAGADQREDEGGSESLHSSQRARFGATDKKKPAEFSPQKSPAPAKARG